MRSVHSRALPSIPALVIVLISTTSLTACNESGNSAPSGSSLSVNSGASSNTTGSPTLPTPTQTPTSTPTSIPTPTPTVTATPTPTSTPTGGALYNGPEEVAKFVQKFVDDAKIQGVDVLPTFKAHPLTIQVASLASFGSSVIGLCEYSGTTRRVTFSPNFWNSVSDTQKELLTHHELGHCILGRAHRNDLLTGGAYASIMYPIIMSTASYNSNYDYYQKELFTWSATAATASAISSNRLSPTDATENPNQSGRHICNGVSSF